MSAIYGILDLTGAPIPPRDCETMEKPFHSKKIDRFQCASYGPCFLGCGLQHVSTEAEKECYPYSEAGSHFVADAIVDNREELKELFSFSQPLSRQGVDGSILFECLQQDFDKALDAMLGAYVFALYEEEAKTLILGNDALGTRSVYYMEKDGRFYFSSLLASLLPFQEKKQRNDRWFVNFYAQDGLCFVNECRMTPYEGIFRLEPGEILYFSPKGIRRRAYWDPLSTRSTLKLPDHEAYASRVRQVFECAVHRTIRGDRDAAILLSGGLDSNAVAAFAAPRLRKFSKDLISFTSVPRVDRPREIENTYYVPDERSYVELLCRRHDNLKPRLVGCHDYNYVEESRKAMAVLEIPYKTIPNMPWMLEAYRRAAEAGCSTLLTGQYGNITISVGNFENLFETLLKSGRLAALDRQARAYGRVYHRGRKWVYRTLLESFRLTSANPCDHKNLNPRFYGKDRRILRKLEGKKRAFPHALSRIRPYMYDKIALRQVGETEQKLSLETGVIPRDPTRDKRLIELILSLPMEELCLNGVDRRLVREDLEDLIPPEITKNIRHRGQQGVGAEERLQETWPSIQEQLRKEFHSGHAEDFLNLPRFLEMVEDPALPKEDPAALTRLIYCGLCSEYLGSHYDE